MLARLGVITYLVGAGRLKKPDLTINAERPTALANGLSPQPLVNFLMGLDEKNSSSLLYLVSNCLQLAFVLFEFRYRLKLDQSYSPH